MNINPIGSIDLNSITPVVGESASGKTSSASVFGSIYDGMIENVNSTNQAFDGDIIKAAAGELDNPQQLVIDSTKAKIALGLVTSVRNDALSAYNDIIKMSI